MNNYQERYIKIIVDIKDLEEKQEELMLLLKIKEEEKKTLDEKYSSLTKELENLKNEKENMLNTDDYISKLTIVLALTIIITMIFHYKTREIATSVLDIVIHYVFLFAAGISLLLSEFEFTKKRINKKFTSVKNSLKYKKVLERIKINEIELENIFEKQKIVAEECLNATLNYSELCALLKIKREELVRFKDEVFSIVVSNLTEIEDKPFTRVRIRDNLNNRN